MYIRSVRFADLILLGQVRQQTLWLGRPESLVLGSSPVTLALKGWLPLASGLRTFVMGDRRPRAFVQVATRARGHIWEVLSLGTDGTELPYDEPTHPWLLLLNSVAVVAGRRRVTRLLAKVPEEAAELACFRQAGYQAYGREVIYTKQVTADDRLPGEGLETRPQRPSDDWLIHRLYFQTVPKAVQDAEAHTSHRWELRKAQPGGVHERGWLLEDGGETVAYARALSRRGAHAVEWLFQPAQRAHLPHLVRQTLARLPAGPGDRLYCSVPEYQSEIDPVLREAGFVASGVQLLMVKYLVVKAAARERLFRPVTAAKSRGVPSYLRRAAGK